MSKNYYIYKHTNKINGKVYIGQTCQKPEYRWNNGEGYKRQAYFYSAIQKYGWNNFEHTIIKNNLSLEEANLLEIQLIKALKTTDNDYGYNIREGGSHGALNKSTIEKISASNKNKVVSDKTKAKLSKSLTGRKLSQTHIQNIKAASKCGFDNPKSKPVLCIDTNIIYGSSGEAERQLGISSRSIRAAASHLKGQKRAGGYEWRFLTKEEIKLCQV